jgi:diguanylate cyclase (GGDEF)-like protein
LVVIAGPDAGLLVHLNNSKFIVGRDPTCHIHLKDESISRFHASIKSSRKGYLIIQDLNSTNGTFIDGKRIHRHRLKEGDKILFGQNTLIRFEKQDAIDESYYDELYFSSTRDALTGIYNRRFCLEKFNTELSYARRHHLPVSLILFDIDLFKKVNDTYGHPTGDRVLSTLATVVSRTVRTEDTFGRYGGEEFIIVAMDTDMLGAQVFAERIRTKIAEEQIVAKDESRRIIHVTVSIGVATTSAPFCYDAEKLIAAADANLYTAKAKGRNRIIASEVFE